MKTSPISLRPGRRLLLHSLAVTALATAVALIFPHHAPDTQRFLSEAKNLAAQGLFSLDGQTPTVRDFPAVPFLLAVLFKLHAASPESWMRFFNGLCLGLTALGGGIWLRNLLPENTPFRKFWPPLAVWAIGLCPELLGSLLFVLTEPLYTALFLWSNLFLFKGLCEPGQRSSLSGWLLGGAGIGLTCLTRAMPLLYIPFLLPVACLIRPAVAGRTLLHGTAAFLLMALVVAPWTLRNYRATGDFIPVAYASGVCLYVGASQEWQAEWPDFDPAERMSAEKGIPLHVADNVMGREAKRVIGQDPVAWIRLLPHKWKRFWLEVPGGKRQIGSPAVKTLLAVTNITVLLLAAAGFWLCRKNPAAWWLLLPVFYTCAVHSALFAMARFRVPIEPYLVCLAVAAVAPVLGTLGVRLRRIGNR